VSNTYDHNLHNSNGLNCCFYVTEYDEYDIAADTVASFRQLSLSENGEVLRVLI